MPDILLEAEDVAISIRSAGGRNFNREKESFASVDDINRLFVYPPEIGLPQSAVVQKKPMLIELFKTEYATNPEISCSTGGQFLPIDHCIYCTVDPYIIEGRTLRSYVIDALIKYSSIRPQIKERICNHVRKALYQEMWDLASIPEIRPEEILHGTHSISSNLDQYLKELVENKRDYQFIRYVNYLKEGTINPIQSVSVQNPI